MLNSTKDLHLKLQLQEKRDPQVILSENTLEIIWDPTYVIILVNYPYQPSQIF